MPYNVVRSAFFGNVVYLGKHFASEETLLIFHVKITRNSENISRIFVRVQLSVLESNSSRNGSNTKDKLHEFREESILIPGSLQLLQYTLSRLYAKLNVCLYLEHQSNPAKSYFLSLILALSSYE